MLNLSPAVIGFARDLLVGASGAVLGELFREMVDHLKKMSQFYNPRFFL